MVFRRYAAGTECLYLGERRQVSGVHTNIQQPFKQGRSSVHFIRYPHRARHSFSIWKMVAWLCTYSIRRHSQRLSEGGREVLAIRCKADSKTDRGKEQVVPQQLRILVHPCNEKKPAASKDDFGASRLFRLCLYGDF